MAQEFKSTKAGEFTLVACHADGVYQGALWSQSRTVERVHGADLDSVYRQLQALLDHRLADRIAARQGRNPSAEEAVRAFGRIIPNMSDGQRAMLRAHYKAPGRTVTATRLAQAATFANFSTANLQYGLLGAMLFAEIPEDLPRRQDGSRVMTCALATSEYPDKGADAPNWVWTMRPHIAEALKRVSSF